MILEVLEIFFGNLLIGITFINLNIFYYMLSLLFFLFFSSVLLLIFFKKIRGTFFLTFINKVSVYLGDKFFKKEEEIKYVNVV